MKKRKKTIVRIAFTLTTLSVIGFYFEGQNLRELNNKVDNELEIERVKVEKEQEKLTKLQQELEQVNTIEYIEKIATEKLKMVEPDTIVIREKQ